MIWAAGALYILNLYYSNKSYTQKHSDIVKKDFDLRFGSEIFSVRYFDATKFGSDRDKNIHFDENEIKFKNESVYIRRNTDEWIQKMSDAFANNNYSAMLKLIDEDYDLVLELNKNQGIYNMQN